MLLFYWNVIVFFAAIPYLVFAPENEKKDNSCHPKQEFLCVNSKECIPIELKCDGRRNCIDGTDETIECEPKNCKRSQFECRLTGKCIPKSWTCDESLDCGSTVDNVTDKSDEHVYQCENPFDCEPSYISCPHDHRIVCIKIDKLCDGHRDCPDGADEGRFCLKNMTESGKTCSYNYRNGPTGPLCFCQDGFKPNGPYCIDINECLADGKCDQLCNNTIGGFTCDCLPGYRKVNNSTCKAINVPRDEEPTLLLTNENSLKQIYLNGTILFSSNYSIQSAMFSLTFDHRNRTVCFLKNPGIDFNHDIMCTEVGSSSHWWELKSFPMFYLNDKVQVELDWVSGNWYILDPVQSVIYMCSHGWHYCILLYVNKGTPQKLALDPSKGYLFFTMRFDRKGALNRMDLSGKGNTVLVDSKIHFPKSITIDYPLEHVYWVDIYLNHVERVNYDGTDRQIIYSTAVNLEDCAITIFETNLYVATLQHSNVIRVNKFNSSDRVSIINNLGFPTDIKIYHRQRQPNVNHPCSKKNGGCEEICSTVWSSDYGDRPYCLCRKGFKVTTDGKCVPKSLTPFLVYTRGHPFMIEAITRPNHMGHFEEMMNPITNMDVAVAVDPTTRYIYYSNYRRYSIEGRQMHGTEVKFLHTRYMEKCISMDVDWIGGNLYWIDMMYRNIFAASLSSSKYIILFDHNTTVAHSIVLDPNSGVMYWGTIGAIGKASMSGDDKTIFVSYVDTPKYLAIDYFTQKLYWIDTGYHKIERINLDGTKREKVVSDLQTHVGGLTILANLIIWTNSDIGLIHSHNLNSGETNIMLDLKTPVYQIKAYDPNITFDIERGKLCRETCDGLCLLNYDVIKCVCPSQYHREMVNGTQKCLKGDFCGRTSGLSVTSQTVQGKNSSCAMTCTHKDLLCDNNTRCIPKLFQCDGESDCDDNTDETLTNCSEILKCLPNQFLCKKSKRCIPKTWLCDSSVDCGEGDASDEDNCPNKTCSVYEFTCRNGNCISFDLVCNGENNCQNCEESTEYCDYSDESSCAEICSVDQIYCAKDSTCYSKSAKCDGIFDCSDKSDEQHCSYFVSDKTVKRPLNRSSTDQLRCEQHEFHCTDITDACIRREFVCDGVPDCLDGSDEANCTSDLPKTKKQVPCHYPNRSCDNSTRCIKPENLCDKNFDCVDGTDEGGMCDERLCERGSTPLCSDFCYDSPEGHMCVCPPGSYLGVDNTVCSEKHRCSQWGVCSQYCQITGNHTHKCYCDDEYILQADQFTCKLNDDGPVNIIFSNRHELRIIDMQTLNVKVLTVGLKNTIALDFYHNNGTNVIYWTDVLEDKIFKGTVENSAINNVDIVVTSGLATAEGLAVDWIGGNLYWAESQLDQIEVARLNGSFRRTLIAGEIESPRAIVLDPRDGLLFWTDWNTKSPRIERASMAGEHRTIIVKSDENFDVHWPNGLTIDYQKRRIYWIDAKLHAIYTADYVGQNIIEVTSNLDVLDHPFAISLYENYIYWTDWRSNSVIKGNKWNASDVVTVQRTLTQPFDIKVMHPSRQPAGNNPCGFNNGNCSHLCLINVNNTYRCACPHVMILDRDGFTCIENDVFLLFCAPNEIRGVDLTEPYYHIIPTISIPAVISPVEMDFYARTMQIYWLDTQSKEVKRSIINGSAVETIINTGIGSPSGFAIDWISDNLFISVNSDQDQGEALIVACNLNGEYFTVIFSNRLTSEQEASIISINSLSVRPSTGNLYWSVMKPNGHHAILSSNMNGTQIITLTSYRDNLLLRDPISLMVDEAGNSLYWVNKGSDSIQYIHLDEHRLFTLPLRRFASPTASVVYKNSLYYSDNNDDAIHVIDKINGSSHKVEEIFRNNTENVNSLIMYDPMLQNGSNPCEHNGGGCQHLCIPTSKVNRVCRCAVGYSNDEEDQTKCVGIEEFVLFSINWEIKGIPMNYNQNCTANVLAPISHISSSSSIDFQASDDYIYWADGDHGVINRIKRDGSGRQTIVTQNHNTENNWLAGIAVDWIAGNIYWSGPRVNVIEVSRTNGSYRRVLISNGIDKPSSIAVDPARGLLFWSEVGNVKRIVRGSLNGSNRTVIVNNTNAVINDISLDYENQILYWCQSNGIYSIYYNGTGYQLLYTENNNNPFGLVVYKGFVYWIDIIHNFGSLNMAPSNNLTNYTQILTRLGDSLKDIEIYSKQRQAGTNPCQKDNGGCEELCLFNGIQSVCACSHGFLADDKKSCKPYQSFIMYSRADHVDVIHLWDAYDLNSPLPAIRSKRNMVNTVGLTFDYKTSTLFYSDIQRAEISSIFFNGTGQRVILDHVSSVEGLAYDPIYNILYWTCYTTSTINKLDLSVKSKKGEIIHSLGSNEKPRGIDIDSCSSMIYWTNWNEIYPKIQRSYTNGYHLESIIKTNIRMPNALTLDHFNQKLYWSDARLDKIERCEFDGTNRVILDKASPQHVFDLTVYGDYLFWTDWILQSVMRCDKYTGDETIVLRRLIGRPMGIIAVDRTTEDCMSNKCRVVNGGCEDICNLDLYGNVNCTCKGNRHLLKDGARCVDELFTCLEHQFQCGTSGCINYNETCNGVPDCEDSSDEELVYCARRKCMQGFFRCDQNSCYPNELKCNGVPECNDLTDELDCPCSADEFRCKSGRCIPLPLRCDDNVDCDDHSDETGCTSANFDDFDEDPFKCVGNSFKCLTGKCIPHIWVCDRDNDCLDNTTAFGLSSDEQNCSKTCLPHEFQCDHNSTCVLQSWVCDDIMDCRDGSDEMSYRCDQRNCTDDEFRCNSTGACIPWVWICDKDADCPDLSDELGFNCSDYLKKKCSAELFQCLNDRCISMKHFCDGFNDCGDRSDEPKNCASCDDSANYFNCKNGRCLPNTVVCNEVNDCGDNSDEHITLCSGEIENGTCANDMFECNNKNCIDENETCNGLNDCGDNSDESYCSEAKNETCPHNMFVCTNNNCIYENKTCDGVNDCGDNSDENLCDINECLNTTLCKHECVDKRVGYECVCNPGYRLIKKNICVDINECEDSQPRCSQLCVNERGSYRCQCVKGYALHVNKFTCKAVSDIQPKILFAGVQYIRQFDINEEQKGRIRIRNVSDVVGLDFEWETGCIYWSEVSTHIKRIKRLCPGGVIQTLHGSNLGSADGIAVDWIGHNIYWCDKVHDTIEVSTTDGKYRKVLINDKSTLQEPRSICLDPMHGYMYWTDWGNKPYIGKAGMDGTNHKRIINTGLGWPNALTLNLEMNELYWGDAKLDYISMSDLDGNNHRVIVSTATNPEIRLHHIFSVAVFEDYIYWSDWETHSIERCNKFTGADCKIMEQTFRQRPMDLKIFHPYKQPQAPRNPCENNGGCSALCLLTPNSGRVCGCPNDYVLGPDQTSCMANCSSSSFICPNTYKCIPMWWKCDYQDDCGDGWDEISEKCPEFKCIPGQFRCNNGECIHPSFICDGKKDCSDNSDELNCNEFTCLETHFKCSGNGSKSAICIPNEKRCNNRKDCINGEDEKYCEKNCTEIEFKCRNNNQCILLVLACDGENDCLDGSDEIGCGKFTCPSGLYRCKNGRCIPDSWICDGMNDCMDGSDESTCKFRTCDPTYFRCDNQRCIPGRWRCDNRNDCGDRSDERNCSVEYCTQDSFRCIDGTCISSTLRCDGRIDCEDSSDEANCPDLVCKNDEFRCSNITHCIPKIWKCDGEVDCPDNSDEYKCNNVCNNNQFACDNGECIPDNWVCDGEFDCFDKSDEVDNLCLNRVCPPSRFRCANHKCVRKNTVCDKVNNCGDNSDEEEEACRLVGRCMNGYVQCKNRRCINSKFMCDGENDCGDNSDEHNCSQKKDCSFGSCSQVCEIKKHDVSTCECVHGYMPIHYDNATLICYPSGSAAYLVIAMGNELGIVDPYQKNHILLKHVTQLRHYNKINALDVLWRKDVMMVFWTNKKESAIWTDNILNTPSDINTLKGSFAYQNNYKGNILTNTTGRVQSIAVDWYRENLFWIELEPSNKRIMASNIKGQFRKTIFDSKLVQPRDIVIDPAGNAIYWSDCGKNVIETANTDTTKRRVLLSLDIGCPASLSIDFPAKRLYWSDDKLRLIECALLDGTDRNIVHRFSIGDVPNKIDVFENYVYATISHQKYIARIHKFGFKNMTRLDVGYSKITDLAVYQQQKQFYIGVPTGKSYKNNSLCVGSPYGKGHVCFCGDNYVEDEHTNNCICANRSHADNCDRIPLECNYCFNGGRCSSQSSSLCICRAGFTGLRCEQCSDLTCSNGVCIKNSAGVSKCVCAEGYSGLLCAFRKCDNYCVRGTCTLNDGNPRCICPNGFTGGKCEFATCGSVCLNGGTCIVNNNKEVTCICQSTYSGKRCEINVCECNCTSTDPNCHCKKKLPPICDKPAKCFVGRCFNGGVCRDTAGNVTCSCIGEFYGPRCELSKSFHLVIAVPITESSITADKERFTVVSNDKVNYNRADNDDDNDDEDNNSNRVSFEDDTDSDGRSGTRSTYVEPSFGHPILTSVFAVIVLCLVALSAYYFITRRKHVRSFTHTRIQESGNAITNPMYLRGDVSNDENSLDHAIPLQQKSIAFGNPVYDTVYQSTAIHGASSNTQEDEKKGLLENAVELNGSTCFDDGPNVDCPSNG